MSSIDPHGPVPSGADVHEADARAAMEAISGGQPWGEPVPRATAAEPEEPAKATGVVVVGAGGASEGELPDSAGGQPVPRMCGPRMEQHREETQQMADNTADAEVAEEPVTASDEEPTEEIPAVTDQPAAAASTDLGGNDQPAGLPSAPVPGGTDQVAGVPPAAQGAGKPRRALKFANLTSFVEFVTQTYRRRIDARTTFWAANWWEFPEAVTRLTAMWLAYEHLTVRPCGLSSWLLDHGDPQMANLMGGEGPFRGSTATTRTGDPLPFARPPRETSLDEERVREWAEDLGGVDHSKPETGRVR